MKTISLIKHPNIAQKANLIYDEENNQIGLIEIRLRIYSGRKNLGIFKGICFFFRRMIFGPCFARFFFCFFYLNFCIIIIKGLLRLEIIT